MGTYAALSDVQARVVGRTIDANTAPTSTQVEQWITEGEAFLSGTLQAVGVSLPAASSDGGEVLKSWATDYAEGHVKQAWLAAAVDGNEDGEGILEAFRELLKDIRLEPAHYDAMLNGGAASGDSSRQCRGYVLDNEDSLSIANGDFDPMFDRDLEF